MDPVRLKETYGDRLTFWGAGIETQTVLPFGAPDEVRAMVKERMRVFGPGGGYVFNTIHNLQAGIPVENIVALYEAVNEYRTYPVGGGDTMALIDELRRAVVDGQAKTAVERMTEGLAEGMPPSTLLEDGLIAACGRSASSTTRATTTSPRCLSPRTR